MIAVTQASKPSAIAAAALFIRGVWMRKTVAVAMALLLAPAAEAALLSNIQGTVLVSSGGGFRPASGPIMIAAGDSVRTVDGSADIVYDNGCSTRVGPRQTAVVAYATPSCGLVEQRDPDFEVPADTLMPVAGALVIAIAIAVAAKFANGTNGSNSSSSSSSSSASGR